MHLNHFFFPVRIGLGIKAILPPEAGIVDHQFETIRRFEPFFERFDLLRLGKVADMHVDVDAKPLFQVGLDLVEQIFTARDEQQIVPFGGELFCKFFSETIARPGDGGEGAYRHGLDCCIIFHTQNFSLPMEIVQCYRIVLPHSLAVPDQDRIRKEAVLKKTQGTTAEPPLGGVSHFVASIPPRWAALRRSSVALGYSC